ncbi:hypothetical protein HCX50_14675 [Microbacterium oxydans]|uniref:hypothetical protein n=1 Tax=Microbacterium sp. B19(2022) TaxID=2914045 RepID=UPI0014307B1B|nr:hypothetical protein [Microbacterium sp. B19(2022)]NJI60674.1 hypothetical protein [Microbacterium sp. B19(2022)]
MNATNRFVNRSVLFLVGAALLVAGVVALAAGVLAAGDPPPWVRRPAAEVAAAWESARGWTWQVMGIGPVSVLLLLAVAAVLVLTVLLVVFLISRRRGRSKTVLDVDTATGRTTVDRNVVDAVLTEPLVRRPDVLSARTGTYRVGQTRAVELAVIVRPGAPLATVVAAAEAAIDEWDDLLGSRIPILLHLSDRRWREGFRSPTRVR